MLRLFSARFLSFLTCSSARVRIPIFSLLLLIVVVYGCANKLAPGGGPYDDRPPRLVSASPTSGALGVTSKRVVLTFDEYVTIQDVANKVIISPPQLQMPRVSAVGKRIVVELEDDLISETTYTLDFTDAVVDNNEQNALENFSFAFSTGSVIDTMELSGVVLRARDHEPVQGVVVGVHADSMRRTAFVDTAFLRMSRTSDRARFVMRNLREGRYRVYALKESDGNYRHDMGGEGIAFMDSSVLTTSMPAVRPDTLWRDSTTIDTIRTVHYTRYMPDDLVLLYYDEVGMRRYLTKRERPLPHLLSLTFNHPMDSVARLSRADTLQTTDPTTTDHPYVQDRYADGRVDYFLTDSAWIRSDAFALSYYSTDSMGQVVLTTDTLRLKPKAAAPAANKREQDDVDEKPKTPFTIQVEHRGSGGVSDSILIVASLPIDTTTLHGIQLYDANDSILRPVSGMQVQLLDGHTTRALLTAPLRYGSSYEIHFDSVAFRDIYGHTAGQEVVDAFKVKKKDEFAQLEVTIHGIEPPFVVELLSSSDRPVLVVPSASHTVQLADLKPDKYALRVIVDRNGNGRWDEGDYEAGIQPEAVYYAPKVFELKKNWTIKENFYPLRTPLVRQKPRELIRNKPREKKKRDLNAEREREMQQRRQADAAAGGVFGAGRGALQGIQR